MAFKIVCLVLALVAVCYGYPQHGGHGHGSHGLAQDSGFGPGGGGFPTQGGQGLHQDSGFGPHGGGVPTQGGQGLHEDTGFGPNGGGFPTQGQGHGQRHVGGYQEHGY